MHVGPVAPSLVAPPPPGVGRDDWEGLKTLIRARLDLVRRGVVAVAEVNPGAGSERNYLRSGFQIAYQRRHYTKPLA